TQDLTAALFAALSVAAIACLLVRPAVRAVLPPGWPAAVAVGAFLLVLPALAAGHSHSSAAHDHVAAGDEAHGGDHSHTELAASDAHDHPPNAAETSTDGHDHAQSATATSADAHDHAASTTASS